MNFLNLRIKFVFSAFIFSSLLATVEAQIIDKIIAVVDSGVILSSDVKTRLNDLTIQAESRGNEIEVNDGGFSKTKGSLGKEICGLNRSFNPTGVSLLNAATKAGLVIQTRVNIQTQCCFLRH